MNFSIFIVYYDTNFVEIVCVYIVSAKTKLTSCVVLLYLP